MVVDGRGEQPETVAGIQLHILSRWEIGSRGEGAVGIDGACPVNRPHTGRGAERGGGEEPFPIAHRGDVGHLPEYPVGRGVRAGEEDGPVVAPCGAGGVVAVEGGGADPVFGASDDNVGVVAVAEEVGITEIVRQTAGPPVDDGVGAPFRPVEQRRVIGGSTGDGGASIVDGGVEDIGLPLGNHVVGEDTSAPAPLDVVGGSRRDGDFLLAPVIEVLRRDMSPVETRHVGPVGIFLEEEMVAAIGPYHTVAFVGPRGGRHTVETGGQDVVGEP